jgi:hypothetical protein
MSLNLSVQGPGKYIKEFKLDGVAKSAYFVPAALTGAHTVDMVLSWEPTSVIGQSSVMSSAYPGARILSNTGRGITVVFDQPRNTTAEMYTIAGRMVDKAESKNGSVALGRGAMGPGAYIVKVNSGKASFTKNVMLK